MVKAKALGPFSSMWPDGMGFAPAPESIIEVDDVDAPRVAHLRALAAGGLAEILEDAKVSAEPKPGAQAQGRGRPAATSKAERPGKTS